MAPTGWSPRGQCGMLNAMNLYHAILKVLLSFPVASETPAEPPADRPGRIEIIAASIASASEGDIVRAARSVTTVVHESRLSWLVHMGRCHQTLSRCDRGRAISPWQLHRNHLSRAAWRAMGNAALYATTAAAIEADRRLTRAAQLCRARGYSHVAAAFSLYTTGHRCDRTMTARVRTFTAVLRALRRVVAEQPMLTES